MRRAALVAVALVAACASRQPDPPRQIVWAHAEAPPAGDASAPALDAAQAPVAAAIPPRPITPVLPVLRLENLRFRDVSTCERGVCRIEGRSPFAPTSVALDDGATALPPAMGWVQVIRPGASVVIPARADVDLMGVVLVGRVSLDREGAAPAARPEARAWTSFLLPGAGAALRVRGREPAAVLLVTATGPAREARAYDYVTRDLAAHDDLAWAGGAMHARIAFDASDSPRASLGVLIASDDAPVAEHVHAESWEMLAAFSAAGRLHLPAQTVGDRALPTRDRTVTGGVIAYVPAGVRHAWVPDGTHPLIAVQVYAPPGPEQRFRALAGAASASPSSNAPAATPAASNGAPSP